MKARSPRAAAALATAFALPWLAQAQPAPTTPTPPEPAPAQPAPTTEPAASAPAVSEPTPTPPTPPPTPAPPEPAAPAAQDASMNRAEAEQVVQGTRIGRGNRFSLNLFGSPTFAAGTGLHEGDHEEFRTGFQAESAVLLLGARLLDQIYALNEMNFEVTEDGAVADIERLEVRWRRGLHFAALGRTHTELGYWNTAYHHGFWLQPTINRPRALRFEDQGGAIPNHSIGAVAGTGVALSDERSLNVIAGVSNGRGSNNDDIQAVEDNNAFKALNLRVSLDDTSTTGLHLGLSALYDRIAPGTSAQRPSLPGVELEELIANVYAVYRGREVLAMAEGYLLQHAAAGQRWTTWAGYVVGGYRFGRWTPYAMVDVMLGDLNDPFFRPDPMGPSAVTRVVDTILGGRVDLGSWNSLRAEYKLTLLTETSTALHTATLNWSFGI